MKVEDPKQLLEQGYDAVCVTTGLWKPIELGIENENLAIKMVDLLSNKEAYTIRWTRGDHRWRRDRCRLCDHG